MSKKAIVGWCLGIILGIILILVVGNALSVVNVFWQAKRSEITLKPRITSRINQTGNAIASIQYFHTQCNDVLGDEQNTENNLQQYLSDEKRAKYAKDAITQEQYASMSEQDETIYVGSKDQLNNDVREYNARSADYTVNKFKAANLPYRFSINPKTGLLKGNPSCH